MGFLFWNQEWILIVIKDLYSKYDDECPILVCLYGESY